MSLGLHDNVFGGGGRTDQEGDGTTQSTILVRRETKGPLKKSIQQGGEGDPLLHCAQKN